MMIMIRLISSSSILLKLLLLSLIILISLSIKEAEPEDLDNIRDLVPFPNLFIIGTQKCGTTSLNKLLFEHPEICSEGVKEKHFYSEKGYRSHARIKDYMYEFAGCKKWQITVDATPSYVSIPEVTDRLNISYSADSLSKKKFILLLRDPVSRHYSEYQRVLRICFRIIDEDEELEHATTTRSPEEKVERAKMKCGVCMRNSSSSTLIVSKENAMAFAEWNESPYGSKEVRRGAYLPEIKRWLTIINRSQLFIMNFAQLVTDTTDMMYRISAFLQIDAKKFLNDPTRTKILLPKPPASNSYVEWDPAYLDCETYDLLDRYYNETNDGLVDFINSAIDKPKSEPKFIPFISGRSKCKGSSPFLPTRELKTLDV